MPELPGRKPLDEEVETSIRAYMDGESMPMQQRNRKSLSFQSFVFFNGT